MQNTSGLFPLGKQVIWNNHLSLEASFVREEDTTFFYLFHWAFTYVTYIFVKIMSSISCKRVVNITNEILCNGATYCLKKGDEVYCNDQHYEIPEEPLGTDDKMFWVYLGVYVGLVLFAGMLKLKYFNNFMFCLCN